MLGERSHRGSARAERQLGLAIGGLSAVELGPAGQFRALSRNVVFSSKWPWLSRSRAAPSVCACTETPLRGGASERSGRMEKPGRNSRTRMLRFSYGLLARRSACGEPPAMTESSGGQIVDSMEMGLESVTGLRFSGARIGSVLPINFSR